MIRKIQPLDIDERWKALLDVENLFDKRDRRTANNISPNLAWPAAHVRNDDERQILNATQSRVGRGIPSCPPMDG
jgi:hypothetical protein